MIMSMSVTAVCIFATFHQRRKHEHTPLRQMLLLLNFPGLRSTRKQRLLTSIGLRELSQKLLLVIAIKKESLQRLATLILMNRTDLKARRQHTPTKRLLQVETSSPLTNRLKRFLESIMVVMKGRTEPTSHLNIARRRGTRIFTEFLPSMKAENQEKTV
jgi:hypothetical protein